jgi:hypothetical protein
MLVLGTSLGLGGTPLAVADTKVHAVLTEEKATHLLNRLGYGPRSGDLERVKRIGLERPRRVAAWRDAPWREMGNPMGGIDTFEREHMATNPPDQPFADELRKRQPGINENYARELMELHTMGVDGGYTQQDVQEVARCFTGWTIEQPRRGAGFVWPVDGRAVWGSILLQRPPTDRHRGAEAPRPGGCH